MSREEQIGKTVTELCDSICSLDRIENVEERVHKLQNQLSQYEKAKNAKQSLELLLNNRLDFYLSSSIPVSSSFWSHEEREQISSILFAISEANKLQPSWGGLIEKEFVQICTTLRKRFLSPEFLSSTTPPAQISRAISLLMSAVDAVIEIFGTPACLDSEWRKKRILEFRAASGGKPTTATSSARRTLGAASSSPTTTTGRTGVRTSTSSTAASSSSTTAAARTRPASASSSSTTTATSNSKPSSNGLAALFPSPSKGNGTTAISSGAESTGITVRSIWKRQLSEFFAIFNRNSIKVLLVAFDTTLNDTRQECSTEKLNTLKSLCRFFEIIDEKASLIPDVKARAEQFYTAAVKALAAAAPAADPSSAAEGGGGEQDHAALQASELASIAAKTQILERETFIAEHLLPWLRESLTDPLASIVMAALPLDEKMISVFPFLEKIAASGGLRAKTLILLQLRKRLIPRLAASLAKIAAEDATASAPAAAPAPLPAPQESSGIVITTASSSSSSSSSTSSGLPQHVEVVLSLAWVMALSATGANASIAAALQQEVRSLIQSDTFRPEYIAASINAALDTHSQFAEYLLSNQPNLTTTEPSIVARAHLFCANMLRLVSELTWEDRQSFTSSCAHQLVRRALRGRTPGIRVEAGLLYFSESGGDIPALVLHARLEQLWEAEGKMMESQTINLTVLPTRFARFEATGGGGASILRCLPEDMRRNVEALSAQWVIEAEAAYEQRLVERVAASALQRKQQQEQGAAVGGGGDDGGIARLPSSSQFLIPPQIQNFRPPPRRLIWNAESGSAVMSLVFADGKEFDFVVSSAQMVILLKINEGGQAGPMHVSYGELQSWGLLSQQTLDQALLTLTAPGQNILLRHVGEGSASNGFHFGNSFEVNPNISSLSSSPGTPLILRSALMPSSSSSSSSSAAAPAASNPRERNSIAGGSASYGRLSDTFQKATIAAAIILRFVRMTEDAEEEDIIHYTQQKYKRAVGGYDSLSPEIVSVLLSSLDRNGYIQQVRGGVYKYIKQDDTGVASALSRTASNSSVETGGGGSANRTGSDDSSSVGGGIDRSRSVTPHGLGLSLMLLRPASISSSFGSVQMSMMSSSSSSDSPSASSISSTTSSASIVRLPSAQSALSRTFSNAADASAARYPPISTFSASVTSSPSPSSSASSSTTTATTTTPSKPSPAKPQQGVRPGTASSSSAGTLDSATTPSTVWMGDDCEVLYIDDLQEMVLEMTQNLAQQLNVEGLETSEWAQLLALAEWDEEQLIFLIASNGLKSVLKMAGITYPPLKPGLQGRGKVEEGENEDEDEDDDEEEVFTCPICFSDDVKVSEGLSGSCGHLVCNDCMAQMCKTAMDDPLFNPLQIRCPIEGCRQPLKQSVCLSALPQILHDKFNSSLRTSFVSSFILSKAMTASCDCGASYSCRDVPVVVRCRCGKTFCVGCKRRGMKDDAHSHGPATCVELEEWRSLIASGPDRFRLLRVKPCPRCSVPVNKCGCPYDRVICDKLDACPNQACDHMSCSCGHEWCWQCSGDWHNHDYRRHNARMEKKERFMQLEKRFRHYRSLMRAAAAKLESASRQSKVKWATVMNDLEEDYRVMANAIVHIFWSSAREKALLLTTLAVMEELANEIQKQTDKTLPSTVSDDIFCLVAALKTARNTICRPLMSDHHISQALATVEDVNEDLDAAVINRTNKFALPPDSIFKWNEWWIVTFRSEVYLFGFDPDIPYETILEHVRASRSRLQDYVGPNYVSVRLENYSENINSLVTMPDGSRKFLTYGYRANLRAFPNTLAKRGNLESGCYLLRTVNGTNAPNVHYIISVSPSRLVFYSVNSSINLASFCPAVAEGVVVLGNDMRKARKFTLDAATTKDELTAIVGVKQEPVSNLTGRRPATAPPKVDIGAHGPPSAISRATLATSVRLAGLDFLLPYVNRTRTDFEDEEEE